MNPRDGQFAFGGRYDHWTRLAEGDPAERRALRRMYGGLTPGLYGRLGVAQWRAPLPGTQVVVKDPFALLSLPAIAAATGAVPVVVYRSAPAVLASYRRMGWSADSDEFAALGGPRVTRSGDLRAMADFWSWGHDVMLDDLAGLTEALVVSHAELTAGGAPAQGRLLDLLSLTPGSQRSPHVLVRGGQRSERKGAEETQASRLHNLGRGAPAVMSEWKQYLSDGEIVELEERTKPTWTRLQQRRADVLASDPSQ